MIKHIFLLLIILFTCGQVEMKATAQAGELIIIGNDTLAMSTCPIEHDENLSKLINDYRSRNFRSTGCWRGYIGIWRLKSNKLYLEKILDNCGEKPYSYIKLDSIFNNYKDRQGLYTASWFTGKIRVVKGKCIRYIHDDFLSTMEYETIYEIKNGIVISKNDYHNHIKKASITPMQTDCIINYNFNGDLFPELANKKLEMQVRILPDINGKLDSVRIYMQLNGRELPEYPSDHPYIKELLRCIRLVPDWEVNFLYGKIDWVLFRYLDWNGKGCRAEYTQESSPDSICYNDTVYALMELPLQYDTKLYTKLRLHLNHLFSKECTRGYTATWELSDKRLYLKNIYRLNESKPFPLKTLFPNLNPDKPVEATWYSGPLQLVYGKKFYTFKNYFPIEIDFKINKGVVKDSKTYRNYLIPRDSISFETCKKQLQTFDWSKYPEIHGESLYIKFIIKPDLNGKAQKIELKLKTDFLGKASTYIKNSEVKKICLNALNKVQWEVFYERKKIKEIHGYIVVKLPKKVEKQKII